MLSADNRRDEQTLNAVATAVDLNNLLGKQ